MIPFTCMIRTDRLVVTQCVKFHKTDYLKDGVIAFTLRRFAYGSKELHVKRVKCPYCKRTHDKVDRVRVGPMELAEFFCICRKKLISI